MAETIDSVLKKPQLKVPARDVTIRGSFITTSSVDDVGKGGATPKSYYTVDGRSPNSLQKSLNIIRMSDGMVRKVVMK
jgi:hypothetical protein